MSIQEKKSKVIKNRTGCQRNQECVKTSRNNQVSDWKYSVCKKEKEKLNQPQKEFQPSSYRPSPPTHLYINNLFL